MKKRIYNSCRCYDFPFYRRDMEWMKNFGNNKTTAMEILKIRYANGELNKEEFDKIRKEIQ